MSSEFDAQDMSKLQRLKENFEEARDFMAYYRCAMMEVETKFKVLSEQFALQYEHNPIDIIKTRLKSYESIIAKLEKLQLPITLSSVENNLHDVAGVKVICPFVDDIYLLANSFLSQDDVRLIAEKDYIKNPKNNGYRSLHLIIEIPIFLFSEKKYIRVEVQFRTIAMEAWANLEHRLRYKKHIDGKVSETVSKELNECALLSYQLDKKMGEVRSLVEKDK